MAAVLIYATYTVTNARRQIPAAARGDSEVAYQAMVQGTLNAVRGHTRLERILDTRWLPAAERASLLRARGRGGGRGRHGRGRSARASPGWGHEAALRLAVGGAR